MGPLGIFQEGGWTMWIVLLCTLATTPLAVAAAITAFASKRKGMVLGLAGAALLFSLSTACVGVSGYLYWMQQVDEAIAFASDGEVAAQLREVGEREASWNWMCGLLGAALPIVLSSAALLRGAMIRGDASAPSPRG
jgi:hypothetical protein